MFHANKAIWQKAIKHFPKASDGERESDRARKTERKKERESYKL